MAVTLSQVARHADTSVPTVSRVLNGKSDAYAEETVARVRKALKDLDYRPNWRARSLARRRSGSIGLVYGRPADYVEGSRMVSALVEQLADRELDLMLIPAIGPLSRWSHKLRDGRVDGCLITYPVPLDVDAFVAEHSVPAVMFNLRSDADVAQVIFDDKRGATDAVRHLLDAGHRRITYYRTSKKHGDHYSFADRVAGYTDALKEAGLTPQSITAKPEDYARELAATPPAQRPTALVVYNDTDAMKLIDELRQFNISVPRDLSLVSFNNDERVRWSTPRLTTVAPDIDTAVDTALGLLLNAIDDGPSKTSLPSTQPTASRVVLPETLTVRSSTRTCPPA
ncbi:MAG: LacI family DNA-binding transcriptional regulator [Planctomycetota bacterium]